MRKSRDWKSEWHDGCYRSSGPSIWHCGVIERVPTVSYGFLNASLYLDHFYIPQSCAVRIGIELVLGSQSQFIKSEMYS